jgi:hypothetical protein
MGTSTTLHDASARPAINPDTAWFLDFLFGEQAGWLCLGYVGGDPSIKGRANKKLSIQG